MTSVGAVTRQIAALELSKQPSSTRSFHPKNPSQSNNVSKLLSKFAAPNPFPNTKPPHPLSSLRDPTPSNSKKGIFAQKSIDIGSYDGGLEIEDAKRGELVYGEAAEELALDSSVSRYVSSRGVSVSSRLFLQKVSNTGMASQRL